VSVGESSCGGPYEILSGGQKVVQCDLNGDKVRISKKDKVSIQICEVEVYGTYEGGDVKVAPILVSNGKPASMSSTSSYPGPASLAVDGNTNTNWGGSSCTHTNTEQSPWWAVDLQSSYNVESVKVWNRGDCCGDRLNGFGVKVGNAENSGSECGSGNNEIPGGTTKTVECSGNQGSYVTIYKTNKVSIQICEVEVYATPTTVDAVATTAQAIPAHE